MKAMLTRVHAWRRAWTAALLVMILGFMLTAVVSANSLVNDQLMWTTICHTQPGQPDSAQTMVIYWSALDKCLSHFGDTIGPCP